MKKHLSVYRARSPHRRGAVVILVALLLVVIVGFLGLAVDTLYAVRTAQQLQSAADGAALAGAGVLMDDPAALDEDVYQKAMDIAFANDAAGQPVQLVTADIAIGWYDRDNQTFEPFDQLSMITPDIVTACHDTWPDDPPPQTPTRTANAVKVTTRRTGNNPAGPLQLLFGSMFGVNSVEVSRTAIAIVDSGKADAAIIVLHETAEGALNIQGNAKLEVHNGSIQVNSRHGDAVTHSGRSTLTALEMNVVGGLDRNFLSQVHTSAVVNDDQPAIPDPLAAKLTKPAFTPKSGSVTTITGTKHLYPGYYAGGIRMTSSNARLYLHKSTDGKPSIYILDGIGLDISGGRLDASEGVLIYLVDSTPSNHTYSGLNLSGNPTCIIRPINEGGIYDGLSIWQDKDNGNSATFRGTPDFDVRGTVYLPNATLNLRGTGDCFASQLIVEKLDIGGNAQVVVDYGDGNTHDKTVFLVR